MLNIASHACSPYPWLHCLAGLLQIPRNSERHRPFLTVSFPGLSLFVVTLLFPPCCSHLSSDLSIRPLWFLSDDRAGTIPCSCHHVFIYSAVPAQKSFWGSSESKPVFQAVDF